MAPIIRIELWRDEDGKEYVREFLFSLGADKALSLLKTIDEVYTGSQFEDLLREENLQAVEGHSGLYALEVKKKRISVHLLGCIRGGMIVLVHGVKKGRLRPIHPSHYETAELRIKKLKY